MSGLRRRFLRSLGVDPALAAQLDELSVRVAELDERNRVALDRQETLVRELAADLTERVAAFERRLDALEVRDQ
jgi:ParB-like chromosome segregation protein Spo0J